MSLMLIHADIMFEFFGIAGPVVLSKGMLITFSLETFLNVSSISQFGDVLEAMLAR